MRRPFPDGGVQPETLEVALEGTQPPQGPSDGLARGLPQLGTTIQSALDVLLPEGLLDLADDVPVAGLLRTQIVLNLAVHQCSFFARHPRLAVSTEMARV